MSLLETKNMIKHFALFLRIIYLYEVFIKEIVYLKNVLQNIENLIHRTFLICSRMITNFCLKHVKLARAQF